MFALSRDGDKVFMHQPESGIAVPVLLDLGRDTLSVRMPSVDELEHDYAVFDDIEDMRQEVVGASREKVNFAERFSRQYSTLLRDRILEGKVTIAELRAAVEKHLARAVAAVDGSARAPDPAIPMAVARHLVID